MCVFCQRLPLILSTCLLGGGGGAGVFFGWVVFRDGGLVWCLCGVGGFVGLGLLFLQHVETGIQRVHGGQSIFLVQYS